MYHWFMLGIKRNHYIKNGRHICATFNPFTVLDIAVMQGNLEDFKFIIDNVIEKNLPNPEPLFYMLRERIVSDLYNDVFVNLGNFPFFEDFCKKNEITYKKIYAYLENFELWKSYKSCLENDDVFLENPKKRGHDSCKRKKHFKNLQREKKNLLNNTSMNIKYPPLKQKKFTENNKMKTIKAKKNRFFRLHDNFADIFCDKEEDDELPFDMEDWDILL